MPGASVPRRGTSRLYAGIRLYFIQGKTDKLPDDIGKSGRLVRFRRAVNEFHRDVRSDADAIECIIADKSPGIP